MKTSSSARAALWIGLLLLCGSLQLREEQFGLFTYRVLNANTVEITAYPKNATGPVEIPAAIAGKQVTSIFGGAFQGCTQLTSVTLPSNLTTIGECAFRSCTGLTSLSLPSSLTSIGHQAFYECTGLTSVTLPSSLTSFGIAAFSYCTKLTSVTLPSGLRFIGEYAFSGCTGLIRALFLGNAPPEVESGPFRFTALGFTIYYLSSRTGFSSPTWKGYPATRIDETTYSWLLRYGLQYETTLQTDPDGDGVNLLMAFALDLDPTIPQRRQLPVPVLAGNTLSLSFPANKPGLTYRAETSTNLTRWTSTGVTQSAPGPDGRSTASVPLDAPSRFLRLVVVP